jgi:hypothetical protein
MKSRLQEIADFMDQHHFTYHQVNHSSRRIEAYMLLAVLLIFGNAAGLIIVATLTLIMLKVIDAMHRRVKLEEVA